MHTLILACWGVAALVALVGSIRNRSTEAERFKREHLIPAAITMAIGLPWTALLV